MDSSAVLNQLLGMSSTLSIILNRLSDIEDTLQQVTEEVKANLSFLRDGVEKLHEKADIQANKTTAIATCCETVELIQTLARNQQQQHTSLLTYTHLSNVPYVSSKSCQQLAEDYPSAPSGYYWLGNHDGSLVRTYCIMPSPRLASSCQQLAQDHPQGDSGYYWVRNGMGQPTEVYCDMERHCCNSTGGWMRVAHVDMTNTSQQCPSGLKLWTLGGVRSCGIDENNVRRNTRCNFTTFPSHGIEYSRVCGRIEAYQYGGPWGFNYLSRDYTIDDMRMHGVSITHGRSPRKYIWTLVAAYSESRSNIDACPCTRSDQDYTGIVPPFIGEDYFCDTAISADERYAYAKLYTNDPLWDGQGCGQNSTCCSFNSPPWFCKQLPSPTTDDIELKICGMAPNGHTPFNLVEIYIR